MSAVPEKDWHGISFKENLMNMTQKRTNSIKRRWLYLIIAVVAMLFAGIIYAWSILKGPLAGDFGWTVTQLSVNFTIMMCTFCIGGVLGGLLAKRIGTKVTILLGGVLGAAGFILSSAISGNSIVLLYLFYGVLAGLGIGIAYNTVISTVNAWFPDKKGTSSGIMLMAFGASTLLLGSLAETMFRLPEVGWRKTLLFIGIALGTVLAVSAFIVKKPKENTPLPETKDNNRRRESIETKDLPTLMMVKRPAFWMAFVSIMFLASAGNSVISFAKDLAVSVGIEAAAATFFVGMFSVCNGLGRIIFGILFDFLGCRKGMLISAALTILATGMILGSVLLSSVALCAIGLCLAGLSYGSCPTSVTTFVSVFYGTKNFATNFSVLNFNLIGTSFIATFSNVLMNNTGGYSMTFVFLMVLAIVALVLNILIRRP